MTYAHLEGYKQTLLARDSSHPPATPGALTQMHVHPRGNPLPLSLPPPSFDFAIPCRIRPTGQSHALSNLTKTSRTFFRQFRASRDSLARSFFLLSRPLLLSSPHSCRLVASVRLQNARFLRPPPPVDRECEIKQVRFICYESSPDLEK